MSIIEQATRRLEQLNRAGISVPWRAAGLATSDVQARVESGSQRPAKDSTPVAGFRRLDEVLLSGIETSPRGLHAQNRADAPVAAILDLERIERSGHLVPTQSSSDLAEEFRQIKRPLLRNARSQQSAANRLSLIMVTSALPGEGKTFCAINLAMSMAGEVDTSVLLVDADVVRPELPQRLGIAAGKGLLDVLTEPHFDLSSVVLKTNVPKLSILLAGTHNNMSTELLASEAMEVLLVSLATRYPNLIVIFDAPPLLVTNEAKVLAARIGQVMLVVEASKTPRSVVAQALDALAQCPNVMSVLNKSHEPGALGYGYYRG